MEITSFQISSDKTKIDLTITDAAAVVSLRLWTDATYKEFSDLIDLSAKLTGASTENIEIFPSDLGESFFDGIYYIEAEDPTESSLEFTQQLSKYEDCALVAALDASACADCLTDKDIRFGNIKGLLNMLEYAIELRYINEMQIFIKALDKFCTEDCTTCGAEVEDISSFENSNPDTIDIVVDGGSLD